jgi:outer membrane protein
MLKNNKMKALRTSLSSLAFALALAAPSAAQAGAFEDALISTYNTNPQLKLQRQAVEKTDETVNQAVSGWRPTVSADYQKGRQRNAYATSTWEYSNSESKSLSVSQPIFNGGATLAGTRSAKENVKAARADLKSSEQDILLQAITAYMNVVRDQSVVELNKGNVEVLEKQLQASKSRFSVGEVTRTDVAQSEARLSRARTDLTQSKGALESSRANYERVIGNKPEKLSVPENFPAIPASLDEALNTALKAHPDVIAAERRQTSSKEDVAVSRASILPSVKLTGNMRRQEGAGVRGRDDYDSDDAVIGVNIPLYQSGAEYSRIRQAKITASQRQTDLDDKRDAARETVTRSWENLQTSIASIKSNEDTIHAAEVALNGVRQEQLYGSRTVLDVLDAEQELFTAKVNLVRAQRDRIVNFYTLLSSVGKLTIADLNIKTPLHDPEEHYDDVKYKMVGF